MSNNGTSKRQRSAVKLPFAIIKALLLTLLFAVILIFAASLLLIRHPDPLSLTPFAALGIWGATALFCGFFTAKYSRGAFPAGLLGGLVLTLLLLLIALVAGKLTPSLSSLLPFPLGILLSGIGGLWGRRRRLRRRRH